MKSRSDSRKRTSRYIMEQGKKLDLNLDRSKDKTTAADYCISLHDLLDLKEGLSTPPEQLVLALKSLLKGVAKKAEKDEYLVRPFRSK